MQVHDYSQSRALFQRASKVIPAGIYGHLGPSEGCFIPVSAYPFYVERAAGTYMWDLDGNRYIDYMCAYGPNILGYGHKEVDQAAVEQLRAANCTTLASQRMVELAELLVDTVASADWAFFAKNGGDVTNLAVLTARAATGRDKIVKFKGGYHGVQPWMQAYGYPGVTSADLSNVISIDFNDVTAFANVLAQYPGQIACLIATPYHHPAFGDSALPEPDFWPQVRKLCDQQGVVLIIDDVRCGFRLDTRGSDYHYGFKADLICFCKALANGWNISALCGQDAFKAAVSSVFYTGSYWLSAVPMAAALKTLEILRSQDGPAYMKKLGLELTQGLQQAARAEGFQLKVTGEPAMWFMRLEDDASGELHQAFVANCVRRGVFFTNHHNLFMNCALTAEDVAETVAIARQAFAELRLRPEGKNSF